VCYNGSRAVAERNRRASANIQGTLQYVKESVSDAKPTLASSGSICLM